MIIAAKQIFDGASFTGPGAVVVENGRIAAILPDEAPADLTLETGCLAPGLIDLHNNGAFGVDCATATPDEWTVFIEKLAACGVTSVLPTIITAPIPDILHAAKLVAEAAAVHPAILGLHLEGPFLSPKKPGAHRPDWLRAPDTASLDALLADPALAGILRVLTLAPELPGALAAIRRLTASGLAVSLGHTAADAAQMLGAASAGARLVTHVFSAQSALHHRAPGAPGVALTDERLWPCIIVDGLHVDPIILKLAFAACPRLIAVSDSILVAGLPEGAVRSFGGADVRLSGGIARRADGTIAGAAITLDQGVRRLIAAGISPATALAAATSRPAAALGLQDRGRIAPGARADLVWWDVAWRVARVWTGGAAHPNAPVLPRGTEAVRADLADLETRPMAEIVRVFLAQEEAGQAALGRAAEALARLAAAVAAKLAAGGRLFYAGAGTSGRLALLDAVECGPTFGVPAGLIIPLLAGGDKAFLNAVEGAEDDGASAVAALDAHNFGRADALVGIAASGATPFTVAALRHAAALGGLTGAIVNNAGTRMGEMAGIAVVIETGAEVIAGSTRLSAGTAQKIALNILSSAVMIRLGKTFGPYMVDVRPTNKKLRRRAITMTAAIAAVPEADAEAALRAAAFHVKTAVVMLRTGCDAAAARNLLDNANGSLRTVLAGRLSAEKDS